MVAHSKFLEILEENKKFLKEGKFVKGDEDTELPPTGEEEPETPEEPQEPTGEEEPQPTPPPESDFSDREIDILNVALQIYRGNPESPIEYKNDFSELFENGQYEDLLSRLIAIADELI